jgi:hypothetical protein
MNEITYLGICSSLAAFLGSALSRRFPEDGIVQSQIIINLSLLVVGLGVLTVR